jgi:hypothetical protein
MEDRFIKYSKLYAIIFLMFLAVPVLLGLVVAIFYGFSKLVSSSVADISFGLAMVTLAPAILSAVYVVFFIRTKSHPVAWVRILSYIIFVIAIAISLAVLVRDMIAFFTRFNIEIGGYYGLGLGYLASNVGMLFLIAIIQAFTTKKEVDWMDRKR